MDKIVEDFSTMIVSHAPLVFSFLLPNKKTDPLKITDDIATVGDILNLACKPEKVATRKEISDKVVIEYRIDNILERYADLTDKTKEMAIIPYEKNFFEKIIWPLKNAKTSYMFGNYLGTISMCGMICEMYTIILYEMYLHKNNNKNIQNKIKTFENYSQNNRINKLSKIKINNIKILNEDDSTKLHYVRKIRNNYLHLFTAERPNIKNDAKNTYFNTFDLLSKFIRFETIEKGYKFSDDFIEYLKRNGAIKSPPAQ